MKKLTALALVFVVLASLLVSCGSKIEPINVTLIVTANDEELFNMDIELNYKDPTVMMLVQEANILHNLGAVINENGDSVVDIGEYTAHDDENGISWFWEYMINDVYPDAQTGGKANAQAIVDGDVIHYVYASFDPASVAK